MNPALIHLLARSMRGRLIRALRLLKQPKYSIGIIVFVAWIGFWVGGPLLFDDDGDFEIETFNAEMVFAAVGEALPVIRAGVALLVALLLSLWWLLPWSRVALNFTEAEIHVLRPLPIKRRHLIQFATLKSQPGILFGCLMMTIFIGAGGPLQRLGWYAQFWVVLTLWDLHSKGRSLWLEKQKEVPAARRWRNRIVLVAGILVYWVVLGWALAYLVGDLLLLGRASGPEIPDFEAFSSEMGSFVSDTLATFAPRVESGLIGWLLWPFVLVSAPLFITAPGVTPAMQAIGIGMPVVLLVAHNEWVVRSQAKFEEAALAHARREANKTRPAARYWKTSKRSRRRTSFALLPTGAPEAAILWKNSMIVTRFSYRSLLLFGLTVTGVAFLLPLAFPGFRGVPYVIISIGFMTMALSPLTGSQSYRNDLRADLLRVEIVRTWPIEGWRLFAAEAAAPTLFASFTALLGAALVLVMSLYITFSRLVMQRLVAEDLRLIPDSASAALGVPADLILPLIVLGAIPVVLALTCLSTTLQNLLVLLFPGWVQLGNAKQQGAAAFGQNMIMFFGLGLASLLCLLPAALLVGIIIAIQWFLFGVSIVAWEFPVFGIIAALPVLTAAALIVRAGGRAWDRLDPSRELLEGGA